ncbi:MAG: LuxR C-terminal-related transcriptional regulator [Rudaea sp.]
MIKVWIVARLPLIREGLRGLLAADQELTLASPSPVDANALTREMADTGRGVALLDVDVLEHEGWGLLGDITQAAPGVAPIIVGDSPDDRRIGRALALGARGYLLRESTAQEMSAAVRSANLGLLVLDPGAAESLLAQLQERAGGLALPAGDSMPAEDSRSGNLIEPLSERELEVLRLMVRGLANKQIAAQLFITEHTVKFHIRSILGKLGAANRTEAVTLALGKGLVSL